MQRYLTILAVLCTAVFSTLQASCQSPDRTYINAGVGISGYGIPVQLQVEIPIADNQSIGVSGSFRTYRESYYFFNTLEWRHTVIGIHGSYQYYLDEHLSEYISDEWDFFAGGQIAYYIVNTRYTGTDYGTVYTYSGSSIGNVGVGALIGARYHIPSKNNLCFWGVLSGGLYASGLRAGLSIGI